MHLGLVKVKYLQSRTDSNTSFADFIFRLLCTTQMTMRLLAIALTCQLCVAGKRAKLWATFNEPGVHAMCAYIAGNHPPGKLMHFRVGPLSAPSVSASLTQSLIHSITHQQHGHLVSRLTGLWLPPRL